MNLCSKQLLDVRGQKERQGGKLSVRQSQQDSWLQCVERLEDLLYGIWSNGFLPRMAECRVHMGARYIFFTFGTRTHSWLIKETMTKQVLAPNCGRCQLLSEEVEPLLSDVPFQAILETKDVLQVSLGRVHAGVWQCYAMFASADLAQC